MKAVDRYVVYDDVNYIKRGWVNRNNILVNGEKGCSRLP
ncbi:WbqC family protein [Bacteroides ovatus]|nr:WbqC family protein [Bacteroides ovatus]